MQGGQGEFFSTDSKITFLFPSINSSGLSLAGWLAGWSIILIHQDSGFNPIRACRSKQ